MNLKKLVMIGMILMFVIGAGWGFAIGMKLQHNYDQEFMLRNAYNSDSNLINVKSNILQIIPYDLGNICIDFNKCDLNLTELPNLNLTGFQEMK